MSSYKVTVSSRSSYNVKSKLARSVMPQRLTELEDVQLSDNLVDNYVLIYDANTRLWKDANPDEVLIASATDETPGFEGIPQTFEDNLNIDGGSFDAGGF